MTTTNTPNEVTSVTPYKAAQIVNALLLADGIEKVLPPQMFYNYTTARVRANKNSFIALDEDGKIVLTSLNEWYTKYTTKLMAKNVEAVKS